MPKLDFLKQLLLLQSTSGDEHEISAAILSYIISEKSSWKVIPEIFHGGDFHDCILLKFGSPRTAVFAHMDTIGFMVRYANQLIPIGGPELIHGTDLVGRDRHGAINCKLIVEGDDLFYDFPRKIERGTRLSFAQNIRLDKKYIQAAYLDNRLGVYNALQQCETLEDGWIVFTTYEEHGGGSMPHLLSFIQRIAPVKQALISDITWITDGVQHHEGVVVSVRDKFIPRRIFLDRILQLVHASGIPYQVEVEAYGGSDGREIQFSPFALDWCFIGAAEDFVHSPDEKVSLQDLDSMVLLYRYLLKNL